VQHELTEIAETVPAFSSRREGVLLKSSIRVYECSMGSATVPVATIGVSLMVLAIAASAKRFRQHARAEALIDWAFVLGRNPNSVVFQAFAEPTLCVAAKSTRRHKRIAGKA
jgi:hypothetical protein